ncbi:MAG: Rpn family recombination-promoting nuclease/putative transposase [Desulfococcaceae bacterium]
MEEITNIHDRFFRETFSLREIAQGFLNAYLPDEIRRQVDLSTLDIVKDSFIDKELREHRSDITYTVRMQDVTVYLYLLFEHKSFPDPLTGFQLLRYIVRLGEHHFQQNPRSKKFPPVFPMVFYHGKTKWKIPGSFQHLVELKKDSPLKPYTPEFCFRVYDISHLKDEEIRGQVMARMVMLIAKHIFRPDLRQRLPEILSMCREIADRQTALELLEIMLRYAVHVRKYEEREIREILTETKLEEGIMQTFIDRYIEQGQHQGESRFFRKMMESRFGSLPEWVMKKIETAPPETVEKWGIRLLKANSLEDVLASH